MLIITMAAVSQRYSSVVNETYSIYTSNLVVVSKTSFIVEGLPLGGVLPQSTTTLVSGVGGVTSVTPMLIVVDVKQGAVIPTNITIGVPLQNFTMFQKTVPLTLRGAYPTTNDQIVVGAYLAKIAKLTTGSVIKEGNTSLTISGIISTSNLILGSAIIMPLPTAQSTQGYGGLISAILVWSSPGDSASITQSIDTAIPGVMAIDPRQSNVVGNPLVSSIGSLNQGVDIFSLLLSFLFVAIIASVNILEQREEYHTMQAIGSSSRSILRVTLSETSLICLIGVAIGFILSTLAVAVFFQLFASIPFGISILDLFGLIPISTIAYSLIGVLALGLTVAAITTNSVLKGR
jgi:ABC-type lipoprotein release transport system permease subunit